MSLTLNHFYRFGEFTVDTDQKVLIRHGAPLPTTPKVYETLLILIENSGKIVGKDELMGRLWPDSFVEEANLTVNIQQLRKVLGDNARRPIFIETVPRRGYRFIVPVAIGESNEGIEGVEVAANGLRSRSLPEAETQQIEGIGARPPSLWARGHWPIILASVIILVAALSGWLLWSRRPNRSPAANTKVMLAVLPFENLTGDATQDYFSDGLTEEMITQIGNLEPDHLGVIARTSVMHYKNSQESLDQIGRELHVQYVLEGSVRRESDRVRITTQLIQIKDQTHVWAKQYDRELTHLLTLQGEISKEVADEIQLTLGNHTMTESASLVSSAPKSYEAYDLYLKGQYFLNKRTPQGFDQAINYFQQATTKDASYARAYAGLADCYTLMGAYGGRPQTESMQKARAAALRALELDGNLAEAHTALALIVQNYDWDWDTSEKEFQRAIELNPNYATAHHWYAEHLTWLGRFDEALRESERARQLDPLSLIIASDNAAILYFARQYDRAIQQCRAVLEMDPGFPRAHLLRNAYVEKGMFADALADLQKWNGAEPYQWYWSSLAYVYGRAGQQAQAQSALKRLLELNRHGQVDPAVVLWAYAGMGNKNQAFVWMEKAYVQHSNTLTSLKVEPGYDALRSDPRYQNFLHRVGLDQ